jgi:hypothetical protein
VTAKGFVPQVLPGWVRSLAGGVPQPPPGAEPLPPAPPGTIFVLGVDGGYAVPPQRFTLLFGRAEADVHVPIGVDDSRISRRQGRLTCEGTEWWMQNEGQLPIQLPGGGMLLSGQHMVLESGYTPLFLGDLRHRVHSLEVRVVSAAPGDPAAGPDSPTTPPDLHELSEVERLVLTALAQRYLRGEWRPQPMSWNLVARDLNRLPDGGGWNPHRAANVVGRVRERLSHPGYHNRIAGITRDDGYGEPLGNALNHNLIQALLQSTTLSPSDLALLGDFDD